jgi:outer membrane protein W
MEFSLGGVGRAETRELHYYGEDVEVDAVASALIGLRHDLFSIRNPGAMQPYLAFGGGPYWINEILVEDRAFGLDEEVTVKSKPKPGAYAGAGLNFMLSNWFGINFDVKYHFVDLNVNHDYSGWEYGFGVLVAWGRWVPARR